MSARSARKSGRLVVVTALLVATSSGAVACTRESAGPAVTNAADAVVSVRSADGEVLSDVEPDGGAVLLTDDCLEAPLVVQYADGDEITFDAPVCPGQELLVQNSLVRLVEPSDD